jgi:hypothetical protein
VAVGLVAAYETFGTAHLFALYLPTAFVIAASLFCVRPELTPPLATAARWAATGPLALIAALGVALVLAPFGLLVVTVVVVSSPPVLSLAVDALGQARDVVHCWRINPPRHGRQRLQDRAQL